MTTTTTTRTGSDEYLRSNIWKLDPADFATKGDEVARWIETFCVYSSGSKIGQPARLLRWQRRFLRWLFAVDPETRRRKFRWALVGVPKKNGKCLLPGTRVSMADGSVRAVEDIRPGDQVLDKDGTATVLAVEHFDPKDAVEIRTAHGRRLRVTYDHPCLLADGSWKDAGDLELGDRLVSRTPDPGTDIVTEVIPLGPEASIGLQTSSGTHVTEGLVTHNTELAAWIALYMLLGTDDPAPVIVVAAASDEQADLVFGAARRCVELGPLSAVCEPRVSTIVVPEKPGAELRRVAAAAGTNDGKNISVVICDELHEWSGAKGRSVWTVLTNGVGAREEPLILQITTAGVDVEGTVCGEQYRLGKAVAEDPSIDPHFLMWWYEPDERDDYRDPEVWRKANPSWGVTLPDPETYLRDQLLKKRESEFKRYFLDMWVTSEDIWLPHGAWDACENPERDLDPNLPLFVAVDGAVKRDVFAIVAGQWQGPSFVVRSRTWENPYPPGHSLRDQWKLDLEEPLNYIRELAERFGAPAMTDEDGYPIPGPAVGYDPWGMEFAAQVLEGEGINMVEIPQTDARMCPAAEMTYELVVSRRLAHDGDATLRRHVHSAVPRTKERGWRIARPRGGRMAIDAATALVMCVYLANSAEPVTEEEGPSLW